MLEAKDMIKIDEGLLLDLFRLSSPSNREDKVQDFVKAFLSKNRIDFKTDKLGNIFNLGIDKAPMLSSHMDTVEDFKDSPLMKYVRIYDDKEYGKYLRGYGVIGGDDKCGVFIILSMLKKYPNKINFIFSVNEEKGMTGIKAVADHQDIGKVLYSLVLDRRGAADIICTENNYGTKEFEAAISKVGERFGYKSAVGACSDANTIKDKISCANLSVGYYNPHSKREFVILEDLQNALSYVETIIDEVKDRFAPPEKPAYTYSSATCKFCYRYASYDKIALRWSIAINGWLCPACAKKLMEATKEVGFQELLKL